MSDSKAALLAQMEKELATYNTILSKAADTIIDENVSNYPIFVVHQQVVEIGIEIIKNPLPNMPWKVNATTLEEFVAKKLIYERQLEEFKKVYKDPQNYLCLFVLSQLGATFIFLPRKN